MRYFLINFVLSWLNARVPYSTEYLLRAQPGEPGMLAPGIELFFSFFFFYIKKRGSTFETHFSIQNVSEMFPLVLAVKWSVSGR